MLEDIIPCTNILFSDEDRYFITVVHHHITVKMWETFSMSVSPEDGQDEDEVWSIHPDLLNLHLQNFNHVVLQRA
jgi:hypothetical protein